MCIETCINIGLGLAFFRNPAFTVSTDALQLDQVTFCVDLANLFHYAWTFLVAKGYHTAHTSTHIQSSHLRNIALTTNSSFNMFAVNYTPLFVDAAYPTREVATWLRVVILCKMLIGTFSQSAKCHLLHPERFIICYSLRTKIFPKMSLREQYVGKDKPSFVLN